MRTKRYARRFLLSVSLAAGHMVRLFVVGAVALVLVGCGPKPTLKPNLDEPGTPLASTTHMRAGLWETVGGFDGGPSSQDRGCYSGNGLPGASPQRCAEYALRRGQSGALLMRARCTGGNDSHYELRARLEGDLSSAFTFAGETTINYPNGRKRSVSGHARFTYRGACPADAHWMG